MMPKQNLSILNLLFQERFSKNVIMYNFSSIVNYSLSKIDKIYKVLYLKRNCAIKCNKKLLIVEDIQRLKCAHFHKRKKNIQNQVPPKINFII